MTLYSDVQMLVSVRILPLQCHARKIIQFVRVGHVLKLHILLTLVSDLHW